MDSVVAHASVIGWLEGTCRHVVGAIGCSNVGYHPSFNDASMHFLKNGWEASSDFGPLGGAALWFAIGALVACRRSNPVWRLSAVSVAGLLLVCATTSWMPWNGRFLMLPFALATIALVLAICRSPSRVMRGALLVCILFSGVIVPQFSLNKNPAGLWASIMHRRTYTFLERPTMRAVVNDIESRVRSGKMSGIALCAGGDSWILPLFSIAGLTVNPVPDSDAISDTRRNGGRHFALVLNRQLDGASLRGLRLVRAYPEPDSALYELTDAAPVP